MVKLRLGEGVEFTLGGDLKSLLAAEDDSLQHFVWTDVGLEVLWIPQLSNELTKPLRHHTQLIACWPFNAVVVVLSQEVISYGRDMRQRLQVEYV